MAYGSFTGGMRNMRPNLAPNSLDRNGDDVYEQEYYFNGMYTINEMEDIIVRIRQKQEEYNPNSWSVYDVLR